MGNPVTLLAIGMMLYSINGSFGISINSNSNNGVSTTVVDFHGSPSNTRVILKNIPGMASPVIIENGKVQEMTAEQRQAFEKQNEEDEKANEAHWKRFQTDMENMGRSMQSRFGRR